MRIDRSKLARWVFVTFTGIAVYFLVTEHRARDFGVLHYVLLALCPLLLYLIVRNEDGKSSERAPPTPHERGGLR
jgi:phage shock protein PspC (stress-responsive transcriptional regulator)